MNCDCSLIEAVGNFPTRDWSISLNVQIPRHLRRWGVSASSGSSKCHSALVPRATTRKVKAMLLLGQREGASLAPGSVIQQGSVESGVRGAWI